MEKLANRQGFFDIIKLWIENRRLIELLMHPNAQRDVTFVQPESLKQILTSTPTIIAELVNA